MAVNETIASPLVAPFNSNLYDVTVSPQAEYYPDDVTLHSDIFRVLPHTIYEYKKSANCNNVFVEFKFSFQ